MKSGGLSRRWQQPSAPAWVKALLVAGLGLALALAPHLPAHGVLTAEQARRQAGELKNTGVRAYQEGRLAAAAEALAAAININLNDFFGHFYLGLALRDLRRYREAREVLEVAAELDPRYLQVYVALGDVALGQGDPDAGRAWYQKALNQQDNYAPALDGLGRLAEARGDADEAVTRYRQAIEANRGFPLPYVHLGEIYRRQGKLDEAITLYHEAIKYQPDFAAAYRFLGVTYGKLGRRAEATTLLEKAATIAPEDPGPVLDLADLLAGWDDRIQARARYQAAHKLAPDRPQPLLGLADLERREARHDAALALLDEALALPEIDADTETLIRARQTAYRSEARRLAAIATRREQAEDATGRAWAAVALARERQAAGDLPGALAACREALAPLQRPPDLVFECGYYALAAGDFGPAVELMQEAVRQDPAEERALVNLGLAYAGLGRLPSAIEVYQQALELNPGSVEAALFLGNASYRLGRLDDAEAAYRIALRLASDPGLLDRLQRVLGEIAQERLPPPLPLPPREGGR
jgi:tetratricopeptide (TPR) repeat protein